MASNQKQHRDANGRFEHRERDWDMARDWYVAGEVTEAGPDGEIRRRRVVYKDIAERFKVSVAAVGYHARKGNWPELREIFEKERREAIAVEAGRLVALSLHDTAKLVDSWIQRFGADLHEGKVPTRNVMDLDRAARLKVYLEEVLARPRLRQDSEQQFSLAELQRRHAAILGADDDDGLLSGYADPESDERGLRQLLDTEAD